MTGATTTRRRPKAIQLTDRAVAALKTEEVQQEFYDAIITGLVVRVGKGGAKTFLVRYRSGGKLRRHPIGRYPVISLAKAREKAKQVLGDAQQGKDPEAERQLRKSNDVTFGALCTEVLDAKTDWRGPTRKERTRIIDTELRPAWGTRPAASITRRDVVQLIEGIQKRGARVMANRTLAAIRMIFNVGLDRDFPTLESNPAHRIKPASENGRSRFLDRAEIKKIWGAAAFESPIAKGVFRLTLLTAQRVGSVSAMRWSDIDDADVWHIPAAAFKGKRPHLVPLSPEAKAVLAELRKLTGEGEYVFPGRGNGRQPHFNGKNKALQRMRADLELVDNWTIHDFRTTFRTHATRAKKPGHRSDPAGLGIAPAIADAVLGHKEASLGFDRYTGEPERYLLSEKRDALKAWGKFVAAAVKAKQ